MTIETENQVWLDKENKCIRYSYSENCEKIEGITEEEIESMPYSKVRELIAELVDKLIK